jgi:hypothetical protein
MKSITPCSPLKGNQSFGRTSHLYLNPEDGGDMVSQKRRLTSNWLQGILYQEMKIFTVHICFHKPCSSTEHGQRYFLSGVSISYEATAVCYNFHPWADVLPCAFPIIVYQPPAKL